MQITVTDQRGRVTIGKKLAHKHGGRFFVVGTKKEILLIPTPKDPIKELGELGKRAGINKLSKSQIKRAIGKEALREATASV